MQIKASTILYIPARQRIPGKLYFTVFWKKHVMPGAQSRFHAGVTFFKTGLR